MGLEGLVEFTNPPAAHGAGGGWWRPDFVDGVIAALA
jgi:hypothetical protein